MHVLRAETEYVKDKIVKVCMERKVAVTLEVLEQSECIQNHSLHE